MPPPTISAVIGPRSGAASSRAVVVVVVGLLCLLVACPYSHCLSSQSSSSSSSSSSSLQRQRHHHPFASLSPVAFGTLNPSYDESPTGLAKILDSLPRGTLVDTAERYGKDDGDAERALGDAVRISGRTFGRTDHDEGDRPDDDLLVCTKFAPKPWRLTPESVVEACKASMKRLGVERIYLYQLHYSDLVSQPLRAFGIVYDKDEIYWEGMARCHRMGLVENVGVCNYGPRTVRRAHEFFAERHGIRLVSNQVNFNLMRYRSSTETKAACDELGVRVMGYHPLGGGVLSGVYDEEWHRNVPGGLNARRSKATRVRWYQKNARPVIDAVRDVARRRGTRAAEVAINWCVCKGAMPICGARDGEQVAEAVRGAVEGGWRLTELEIAELDAASDTSAEYARGFELI